MWFLLPIISLIILEVFVIGLVGDLVGGVGMAIWIAIGMTFVGLAIMGQLRERMRPERMMAQMTEGDMNLGGVVAPVLGTGLIVLPGFVTDVIGLLMLIPFTRKLFAPLFKKVGEAMLARGLRAQGMGGGMDMEALQRQMEEMQRQRQGTGRESAHRPPPSESGKVKDADFTIID